MPSAERVQLGMRLGGLGLGFLEGLLETEDLALGFVDPLRPRGDHVAVGGDGDLDLGDLGAARADLGLGQTAADGLGIPDLGAVEQGLRCVGIGGQVRIDDRIGLVGLAGFGIAAGEQVEQVLDFRHGVIHIVFSPYALIMPFGLTGLRLRSASLRDTVRPF